MSYPEDRLAQGQLAQGQGPPGGPHGQNGVSEQQQQQPGGVGGFGGPGPFGRMGGAGRGFEHGAPQGLPGGPGTGFDMNEFPSLNGGPGGLVGSGTYASTAAAAKNSEFSISAEDFPALPGGPGGPGSPIGPASGVIGGGSKGVSNGHPNGGSGGASAPESQVGLGGRLGGPVVPPQLGGVPGRGIGRGGVGRGAVVAGAMAAAAAAAAAADSSNQAGSVGRGDSSDPNRRPSGAPGRPGVPGGAVDGDSLGQSDLFGLRGLLSVIRMKDADLNTLALGMDLTTLGLNLNSPDNLFSLFASPFAETPTRRDSDIFVPSCYFINPELPPPIMKVGQFSDETLFYIFYSMPSDVMQVAAGAELFNRDWRFHKELKLWFTRAADGDPLVKTSLFERGSYIYFDVNSWQKIRKDNFVLEYKLLEDQRPGPVPVPNPGHNMPAGKTQ